MQPETPAAETSAAYDEKIAQQESLVKKLSEDYQKNPSAELKMQLNRKSDTLYHLKNLAKGNPWERARQAAEIARTSALSKVITQPLN